MFSTWIDYLRKCLIDSFESWYRWFRSETWSLYNNEQSKCNILNMRIYNENRNSFIISESSLYDWLTNKSKSCKDSIQDNYNNNYVNWSLKNLLSVILSTYINLNCFIRSRSTSRLFFQDQQLFDLIDLCRLSISDRFCVTRSIFSWQST